MGALWLQEQGGVEKQLLVRWRFPQPGRQEYAVFCLLCHLAGRARGCELGVRASRQYRVQRPDRQHGGAGRRCHTVQQAHMPQLWQAQGGLLRGLCDRARAAGATSDAPARQGELRCREARRRHDRQLPLYVARRQVPTLLSRPPRPAQLQPFPTSTTACRSTLFSTGRPMRAARRCMPPCWLPAMSPCIGMQTARPRGAAIP